MTYDVAVILLVARLLTLPNMVAIMAAERGVDVERALACVEAESGWDPHAVGDQGAAVGLWQIHGETTYGTWSWLCRITGHPEWADDANRDDPVKESIVSLDSIALGYEQLWAGWPECDHMEGITHGDQETE